ncbi:MAG: radical SAM protein [Myxococcota bacterium]|nr:radical SAM protein [Myxococcota bacterium]
MSGAALGPRQAFREFALDGALLYFHPATGVNVRVATAATQAVRRRAPRVAMFGITNACNLDCSFCSRDQRRPSAWTVTTAAAVLRDLAAAGTLEVAFGGGEPFAFRGFAELIAELHATTPLALHATTNGTLIDAATWPAYAGRLGQVRISIYDDPRWRAGARVLAGHGQRWGANVIVDRAALAGLRATLAELATLACADVSLLAYIGPEHSRHLDDRERQELAAIVADAPVRCRLSVCFGDRVPVPRLFDGADGGGDCGAGIDFVSITPDQRVQGCSFQDDGLPGATAAEVLDAWQRGRARLTQPAWRAGCARQLTTLGTTRAPSPPPVAIWQAFSGNNSGECVLVARFTTVADAEASLAELVPGWVPDEPYSMAWQQLFREAGVSGAELPPSTRYDDGQVSPRELVAIGRVVVGLAGHSGDAFPELRALAWKRRAEVTAGGIHLHDPLTAVIAVRARDHAAAQTLAATPPHPRACTLVHGDVLLAAVPLTDARSGVASLTELRELVESYAAGRPVATDLAFEPVSEAALVAVAQRLGAAIAMRPRLAIYFHPPDPGKRAAKFARLVVGSPVTLAAGCLLIDGIEHRRRIAVLAHRQDAQVDALDGATVRVRGSFWYLDPPRTKGRKAPPAPVLDGAALEAALRACLPAATPLTLARAWRGTTVEVVTANPGAVMRTLDAHATTLGCELMLGIEELDPLALLVRRLVTDVRARR